MSRIHFESALEVKADPNVCIVYNTPHICRSDHLGRLLGGKLRNGFSLSRSVSLRKTRQDKHE